MSRNPRSTYPIMKPTEQGPFSPFEAVLWPFPGCAYCGGRAVFGEYVVELALKCEDCPCRMVVPNGPGQKERLFKAWTMRIGEPPKVRVRKSKDMDCKTSSPRLGESRAE